MRSEKGIFLASFLSLADKYSGRTKEDPQVKPLHRVVIPVYLTCVVQPVLRAN